MNLETGLSEPVENGGTNEEALKKYGRTCMHTHVHNYMPLYYIYNLYIIIKYFSQYSFRVKFLLLTGLQKYSQERMLWDAKSPHTKRHF